MVNSFYSLKYTGSSYFVFTLFTKYQINPSKFFSWDILSFIISYRLHFFHINHPSISLPECHQILFLYSCFKSVLEYESYIILSFYNHFLHKAAPNPGIELAGYAVLLFQSANEPFKQFSLCVIYRLSYPFAVAHISEMISTLSVSYVPKFLIRHPPPPMM